jgi:hypothetical protein
VTTTLLTRLALGAALVLAPGVAARAQQEKAPPPPPPVTGKWTMSLQMSQGTATPTLELKQEGEKITGSYTGRYGSYALQGTRKGRAIEFAFAMGAAGEEIRLTFKGEIAADAQTMKGTAFMGEELGEAAWTARREKS